MLFFDRLHHDQVSFTTPFSEERWVRPFWVFSPGCHASLPAGEAAECQSWHLAMAIRERAFASGK